MLINVKLVEENSFAAPLNVYSAERGNAMLQQPISNNHDLNESFYQALIRHFIADFTPTIRALLNDCSFGMAPNEAGINTFFIIAPDLSIADRLIQEKDNILHRVNTLMVSIGQLAICIVPPQNPTEEAVNRSCTQNQPDRSLPQYMMCQIFPLAAES